MLGVVALSSDAAACVISACFSDKLTSSMDNIENFVTAFLPILIYGFRRIWKSAVGGRIMPSAGGTFDYETGGNSGK